MNRKGYFQLFAMPLPELEAYYRKQREADFKNNRQFRGAYWRKMLHPLLIIGIKIKHVLCGQRIDIIGDKRMLTNRPVIYAATHIGWDDVEMICTAIKIHTYILWGDPRDSYRTIDGMLMNMNGVICCDTDDKSDRHIAKETCVRWLEKNGNLLIFPEGAWNITINLPVMKLYNGVAEMAVRTGAEIVPVAIEQNHKKFIVNIGKNIDCSQFRLPQKQILTDFLRDAMATLRWEIWENQSLYSRENIASGYYEQYLKDMKEQMKDIYTLADIESTRYRDKHITEPKDVFSYYEKLRPCKGNAFLFRR